MAELEYEHQAVADHASEYSPQVSPKRTSQTRSSLLLPPPVASTELETFLSGSEGAAELAEGAEVQSPQRKSKSPRPGSSPRQESGEKSKHHVRRRRKSLPATPASSSSLHISSAGAGYPEGGDEAPLLPEHGAQEAQQTMEEPSASEESPQSTRRSHKSAPGRNRSNTTGGAGGYPMPNPPPELPTNEDEGSIFAADEARPLFEEPPDESPQTRRKSTKVRRKKTPPRAEEAAAHDAMTAASLGETIPNPAESGQALLGGVADDPADDPGQKRKTTRRKKSATLQPPAVAKETCFSSGDEGKGQTVRKDSSDGSQQARQKSKSPRPDGELAEEAEERRRKKGSVARHGGRPVRRNRVRGATTKPVYRYCRIRPLLDTELRADAKHIMIAPDEQTVEVQDVEGASFKFDAVFAPGSQKEVFEKCKDLVQGVVDGSNASILSYGQTGAGKSFTAHGVSTDSLDQGTSKTPFAKGRLDSESDRTCDLDSEGIMPQAFRQIFQDLENKTDGPDYYSVKASVMELHTHSIVDLLDEWTSGSDKFRECGPIQLDDRSGIVSVQGLSEHECLDAAELMDLLRWALRRRMHRDTRSGTNSSLKTMIVMVTIVRELPDTQERVIAKLAMVDLVGSEQPKGIGLEFRNAYNELIALRDVLEAIKGTGPVPYGNHVLTSLLQDVLGASARTALILNCTPTLECRLETLRSLQYGTSI